MILGSVGENVVFVVKEEGGNEVGDKRCGVREE